MEVFNGEVVKGKWDTLNSDFQAVGDILSSINESFNISVNVGANSAFYGIFGTNLLKEWNDNAASFDDFQKNFENWSNIISLIMASNVEVTEEVISQYQTTGNEFTVNSIDTTGESGDGTDSGSTIEDAVAAKKAEMDAAIEERIETLTEDTEDVSETPTPEKVNTSYIIDTTDNDADEILEEANNLRDELYLEIELLADRQSNANFALSALDDALEKGEISQVDYETLKAKYEKVISDCDKAMEERSNLYNELNEVTKDNLFTEDGSLKNASDANDYVAAREVVTSLNEQAGNLTSLTDVLGEQNGDDITYSQSLYATRSPEGMGTSYGKYDENLSSFSNYSDPSPSVLTMESAYTVASGSGKTQTLSDGAVLFSTSEFLEGANNQGNISYGGMASFGEQQIVSDAQTYADTNYDCVYYNGKYYTYSQYSALVSSEQE